MMFANSNSAPARGGSIALLCGAAFAAMCGGAQAADVPDDFFLRGPIASQGVVWEGFVVGGQLGRTGVNGDFTNSTSQLVAHILRQSTLESEAQPSAWNVLGTRTASSMSFGGFVGYNWQMDSLILGLDGAYNKIKDLHASDGPTTLQRVVSTSDGMGNDVSITARSSLSMTDYATLRGRAGYAFGQFLPYAFAGGAVGRFDYSTTAQVTVVQSANGNSSTYSPPPESTQKTGQFDPGFVTGLGIDIAILPNAFLRAEWEYAAFGELKGIRPTVNTARVGLGLRF